MSAPASTPAKSYKMPKVHQGQVVLWYDGGDRGGEPSAAIVTRVGDETVNVSVISPDCYNFRIRDGVRHLDDPHDRRSRHDDVRDHPGCWDYTGYDKEFLKVTRQLGK